MEFGATYPYKTMAPSAMSDGQLKRWRGSHGRRLSHFDQREDIDDALPSHSRAGTEFPAWKIKIIELNRNFYQAHRSWLDPWIQKISKLPSSYQKLEWNAQGEPDRRIRNYIIQLRPSGVRVRRPTAIPALIASTSSQIPIVGWEDRYLSDLECARLQSLDSLSKLPDRETTRISALGNAVNATLITTVAESLLL
jgi:DNA (cytosine-5)-methyltransferase 1